MDLFDQFVTMVAEARHMDKDTVRKLANGRAYTGRQALQLGLVDQIGGEEDARDWLGKEHGIADACRSAISGSAALYAARSGPARLAAHLAAGRDAVGAWSIWPGFTRS